jgi:translation elongation factor EF-Tu-like GTPase
MIERFTDLLGGPDDRVLKVLARISVVKSEVGGRAGPFRKNYRPNHNFGGPKDIAFYIGQIEVPEGEWVHPGETRDLEVMFLPGPGLRELAIVGRQWRIQEGSKLVATATVLRVNEN